MRLTALLTLCLAACSEWDLTSTADGNHVPTGDTDGTPPAAEDGLECGALDRAPLEISVDEACEIAPAVGTFTPVIKWKSTAPGDVYSAPVVAQLTDDNSDGIIDSHDMPDIVTQSYWDGSLYVFSGDGSGVHWTIAGVGSEPATPAIADVDGDGGPDIVTGSWDTVAAYRGIDGKRLWTAATGLDGCRGPGRL
jgi:hypothetical protein